MNAAVRLLATVAVAAQAGAVSAVVIYVPAPRVDISQIEEGTSAVVATGSTLDGPTYIDVGTNVAFMRTPKAIDATAMASAFGQICIDTRFDQSAFDEAAAASSLGLKRKDIVLPPLGKNDVAVPVTDWQSSSVRAILWPSSTKALKNRRSYERWRAGATVGGFKPHKLAVAECDMLFDVTGMSDPAPLVAGLTAKLGVGPAKSVSGSRWADGHWSLIGADGLETRIVYSVIDMRQAAQSVHLAIIRSQPALGPGAPRRTQP